MFQMGLIRVPSHSAQMGAALVPEPAGRPLLHEMGRGHFNVCFYL